jgi:hypothetical protein
VLIRRRRCGFQRRLENECGWQDFLSILSADKSSAIGDLSSGEPRAARSISGQASSGIHFLKISCCKNNLPYTNKRTACGNGTKTGRLEFAGSSIEGVLERLPVE